MAWWCLQRGPDGDHRGGRGGKEVVGTVKLVVPATSPPPLPRRQVPGVAELGRGQGIRHPVADACTHSPYVPRHLFAHGHGWLITTDT
jgi:hypothetical protein